MHQFRSIFNGRGLGSTFQTIKSADSDLKLVLISVAFIVVLVVGMVPSNISSNGTTTNIFAHFIGLEFGFFVTLVSLKHSYGRV